MEYSSYPCSCELCFKYKKQGYLKGRKWVDYLFEHDDYALVDGDFYYYHDKGIYYMLRDTRPVEMEKLGYEEGILPEHFNTWKVEPIRVYETPFIHTELFEKERASAAPCHSARK